MAGFVYFIRTDKKTLSLAELREAGLGHAFESEQITCRGVGHGPDGQSGLVVAAENVPVELVGHYPDRQRWRKVPKGDAYVGCATGQPPVPADLVRKLALNGHLVRLGDGREWLVPVARGIAEADDALNYYIALPQATTVDDDGNWLSGSLDAKYAALWTIAERWWSSIASAVVQRGGESGEARVAFDFAEVNDGALAALTTNYRLGKGEVALLGLFTDQVVREVLNALVDWPVFLDWIKKKEASGPQPDAT